MKRVIRHQFDQQETAMKNVVLWLLGVPISVLIVLNLAGVL